MQYVIYARKSSESDDRQAQSIDDQLSELRAFAKSRKIKVVSEFTEAQSAKKVGRPIFAQMLKFIQEGRANSILVWKVDRLARNAQDGGAIIQHLDDEKIIEIQTPSNIYRASSNDKFTLVLEFGMASKYSDDLKDNVIRGMKSSLEKGFYPYQAPIGYLDAGEGVKLVDKEKARIIKLLFELRADKEFSYEQLMEVATKEGLRTRKGNLLSSSSLAQMLSNKFYIGIVEMGKRRNGKLAGTYSGSHDPIVSVDLFDKVQKMLHDRSRKDSEKLKHFFLFRGKVFCSICNEVCYPELIKKKYRYYRCRTKDCPQKCISENEIEKNLKVELKKINFSDSDMETIRNMIIAKVKQVSAKRLAEYTLLQKKVIEIKNKRTALLEEKVSNRVGDDIYCELQNRLTMEQARIEEKIKGFNHSDEEIIRDVESFFELAKNAYSSYSFAYKENKPLLLKTLVSNYYVSGNKAKIIFEPKIDEIYKTWCTRQDSNL